MSAKFKVYISKDLVLTESEYMSKLIEVVNMFATGYEVLVSDKDELATLKELVPGIKLTISNEYIPVDDENIVFIDVNNNNVVEYNETAKGIGLLFPNRFNSPHLAAQFLNNPVAYTECAIDEIAMLGCNSWKNLKFKIY